MYERVVENWLVKANERQYQRPFCQVLSSEGETVYYVSRHGASELGKDIATVTNTGTARGYQLKYGDIGLPELRSIWGELEELVTLDFNYPQLKTDNNHESYLVTNGVLKDPALGRIKEANATWEKKGLGPLRVIQRDMLVARFTEAHGHFFPRELGDLNAFLELYVRDGRKPADKEQLSALLGKVAQSEQVITSGLEIGRKAASITLVSSYLTLSADMQMNHWRKFEQWIVTASSILSLQSNTDERLGAYSFKLSYEAAMEALDALTLECLSEPPNLHLSSPFSEGYIYGHRLTLICGLLAARVLARRMAGEIAENEAEVITFLSRHLKECRLAGESYVIYTIFACLALELYGHHSTAQSRIFATLHYIVDGNGKAGRGVPSTYYGPEESLRITLGRDRRNSEVFSKESYTLETLIVYLARRMNRQALKSVWYRATEVNLLSFAPESSSDWFRWRSENGELRDRPLARPQSWEKLYSDARRPAENIPKALVEKPWFCVLFALVYPHRWNAELFRLIDSAFSC